MSTAMTPEEQLRAMAADASRWELAPWTPTQRPSTAAERPERVSRGRWWAIGFSTVAVVVVAAIVLLVAVNFRGTTPAPPITTNTPSPSSTPSPSPTPPPTSTPTSTRTETPAALPGADGSRPAAVFGGDCAAVLTAGDLDALGPFEQSVDATNDLEAGSTEGGSLDVDFGYTVAERGAIYCSWYGTDSRSIELVAAPADDIPLAAEQTCGDAPESDVDTSQFCAVQHETHGIRFDATVRIASKQASRAAASALVAALDRTSVGRSAPAPTAPADAWRFPSCESLQSAIDAASTGYTMFAGGYGGGQVELLHELMAQIGSTEGKSYTCYGQGDGADGAKSLELRLIPGGGWLQELVPEWADARRTSIDGFDAAYVVPRESGSGDEIWLFRGHNAMSFIAHSESNDDFLLSLRTVADQLDADASR